MSDTHPIAPDLFFQLLPNEGALLCHVASVDGIGDIFKVSMNWQSLSKCSKIMGYPSESWTNRDQSFTLQHKQGQTILTFTAHSPRVVRRRVLSDEEAAVFGETLTQLLGARPAAM